MSRRSVLLGSTHPVLLGAAREPSGRGQADEREGGEDNHGDYVACVSRSEVGDQDRAGYRGAERRAEVGDAARQARDLTLQVLWKAGLDDVDRWGQHEPEPEPDQQQAWCEGDDSRGGSDQGQQEADPCHGYHEAGHDQRLLRTPLGESLGPERRCKDTQRRGGEDDAGLDRVVAADRLQEHGNDEGRPHQQQPLDVLRDEPEVRDSVLEQPGGQQRFFAGSLAARGCRGRTRPGTRPPRPRTRPSARRCCRPAGSRRRRRTCRRPTGLLQRRRRGAWGPPRSDPRSCGSAGRSPRPPRPGRQTRRAS